LRDALVNVRVLIDFNDSFALASKNGEMVPFVLKALPLQEFQVCVGFISGFRLTKIC
jgi:hypothetical protein